MTDGVEEFSTNGAAKLPKLKPSPSIATIALTFIYNSSRDGIAARVFVQRLTATLGIALQRRIPEAVGVERPSVWNR
jgi:hypothetical protein